VVQVEVQDYLSAAQDNGLGGKGNNSGTAGSGGLGQRYGGGGGSGNFNVAGVGGGNGVVYIKW
jgi:hypothetical protein